MLSSLEILILMSLHMMLGKIEGRRRRRATEDKIVG